MLLQESEETKAAVEEVQRCVFRRRRLPRISLGFVLAEIGSTFLRAAKPAVRQSLRDATGRSASRPPPAARAAPQFRGRDTMPRQSGGQPGPQPYREPQRKSWWNLLKETFTNFSEDDASRHGAALAYYGVFSIAPILVIAVLIVGKIWGQSPSDQVTSQLQQTMGAQGADAVNQMISASFRSGGGTLAWLGSIGALMFGATGFFGQLQNSLNTIWEVRPKSGGIVGMILARALSFLMVLVVGALLLGVVALSPVLSAMAGPLSHVFPGGWVLQLINVLVSLAVVTLFFAVIYKVLPDAKIRWKDVWIGAAVTAALFVLGNFLFGMYIRYTAFGSAYGAIGSILVLLLWAYYSAEVFLLGAEFTQAYAQMYGAQIMPAENAQLSA